MLLEGDSSLFDLLEGFGFRFVHPLVDLLLLRDHRPFDLGLHLLDQVHRRFNVLSFWIHLIDQEGDGLLLHADDLRKVEDIMVFVISFERAEGADGHFTVEAEQSSFLSGMKLTELDRRKGNRGLGPFSIEDVMARTGKMCGDVGWTQVDVAVHTERRWDLSAFRLAQATLSNDRRVVDLFKELLLHFLQTLSLHFAELFLFISRHTSSRGPELSVARWALEW